MARVQHALVIGIDANVNKQWVNCQTGKQLGKTLLGYCVGMLLSSWHLIELNTPTHGPTHVIGHVDIRARKDFMLLREAQDIQATVIRFRVEFESDHEIKRKHRDDGQAPKQWLEGAAEHVSRAAIRRA